MRFFYNIGIYVYSALVLVASMFSKKAKLMIEGRRNWHQIISKLVGEKVIWFHAASLGEFEQGKPVLDELFENKGEHKILLTFFSPSGYEIRKDYPKADVVMYLPFDTHKNVRFFLNTLNIKVAVFVKYEFWFNYLLGLESRKIPSVFFSVIFRKNQLFFKGYGKWFLNRLRKITKMFVQNEFSQSLLKLNGIQNSEVVGDTRFDSVLETKNIDKSDAKVEQFLKGSQCVVFGSTWSHDHALIVNYINEFSGDVKFIIAPHEINPSEIESLKNAIQKRSQLYLDEQSEESDVLIVNTIGVLKYIYAYSIGTYIGGGFGKGIHNTLEAAAQSQFVFFGPNYQKFQEAYDLIEGGVGASITTQVEFDSIANKIIEDSEFRIKVEQKSIEYIERNKGASVEVIQYINSLLKNV